MSLDIGTALNEGFRRTFTRNGLLLAVAFVLIGVVSTVAFQTIAADFLDSILELMRANRGTGEGEFTREEIRAVEAGARSVTPFALPISTAIAWLLIVLTAVFAETTRLITVRVCFDERTDDGSNGTLRRNIVVATLNGIVGGIAVYIIVAIGLVFLIVPGIFFAISFLFLRQEIAIEDKNFVDAMSDSWSLAKGNRLELLALVLLVAIIAGIASFVPTFVLGLISPTVSAVAGFLIGGVTAVFGTAVVTRAYAQLHTERAVGEGQTDTDEWAIY